MSCDLLTIHAVKTESWITRISTNVVTGGLNYQCWSLINRRVSVMYLFVRGRVDCLISTKSRLGDWSSWGLIPEETRHFTFRESPGRPCAPPKKVRAGHVPHPKKSGPAMCPTQKSPGRPRAPPKLLLNKHWGLHSAFFVSGISVQT